MHSSGKAEGNPSTCDTAKPLYRHLRRAPAARTRRATPRHALNGARRAHCTNAPPEHTSKKKKKKKRDVVWTRKRDMSDTYYGKEERFFLS